MNSGSIAAAGGTGSGVRLGSGGSVTNAATTASITGYRGVAINGVGTVVNDGTVTGGSTGGDGITLDRGGSITNASAALISGYHGVDGSGGVATITNSGSIKGTGAFGYGIDLTAGGSITNLSSASIKGATGIDITGGPESVVNGGGVTGSSGGGIKLGSGGTVSNTSSSASIIGKYDGVSIGGAGMVVNAGTIAATAGNGVGVYLRSNGVVTNAASATITGHIGVDLYAGGTLTNAGRIVGSGGTAAYLGGPSGNRLIIDPGAVFSGVVIGGTSTGNALELASGSAGGTVTGLGTGFTGFDSTTVDAGAAWTLSSTNTVSGSMTIATGATLTSTGTLTLSNATVIDSGKLVNDGTIVMDPSTLTVAALSGTGSITLGSGSTLIGTGAMAAGDTITFSGTHDLLRIADAGGFASIITNFAATGQIDVQGIGTAKSAQASGDALKLFSGTSASGTLLFTLPHLTGAGGETLDAAALHLVADGTPGGTVIACYLRSTRILSERGEVPIELLCIGDRVVTRSGACVPIRWIGRRRYVLAPTESDEAILPVLIRAGAITDGAPRRDLCVSPEHALFLDGVLVPARHLTNGRTILRREVDAAEYFHLELAAHDVIFAEGAAAETFVDCDSRGMFENASTYVGGGAPCWTFCAPRMEEGELLADIRQRLNARAGLDCGDWRRDAGGPLAGNLERVTADLIEGWAQDTAAPERPVRLEILADGMVAAHVLANRYRCDLAKANLGSGRHAFRARRPVDLVQGRGRFIEVRRAADHVPLPGSPMFFAAPPP